MLVHLRRISAVVAVVLVGLGLVVLDPNAPAALAWQPAPPITWNPSQVVEVPNTLTPEQWNRTLSENPNKIVGNTGVTGSGGSKVGVGSGGAAAAVGGFMVGTEIGSYAAGLMGLPTSGSFWCDLATAVVASGCGLQASPEYEPNSDLATDAEGWVENSTAGQTNYAPLGEVWYGGANGSVRATVAISGPAHARSVTVSLYVGANTITGLQYCTSTTCDGTAGAATGTWTSLPTTGYISAPSSFTWSGPGVQDLTALVINTTGSRQIWYAPEHVLRPETPNPDPVRWWRTTWQCSASAPGGSATSAGFQESDPEWPGFPQAQCDPGSVVTSMLVEQITQGVEGSTTIFEWAAADGYRQWAETGCVGGGCELLLSRIDEVTGRRLSCFANSSLCTQWSEDPAREDKYECTYGPDVVPLSDCLVYVPTFDPEGADYADPDGNVDPNPTPNPNPDPEGPARQEDCPPPFSWSSLVNPWWYYKGVTCALEEAFVPTNSAQQMTRIRDAVNSTTPAVWSAEVSGMFDVQVTEAGCSGPALDLSAMGIEQKAYLFSACEPPMSTAAVWVKAIATVMVVVFGSMAAVRALGSGFGWKPSAGGDG